MIYISLLFLCFLVGIDSYIFDPFNFIRNSQMIRIEDSNVIIDSNQIPLEINEISKEIKESIIQIINENDKDFFNNWNEFLFNNIKNEYIVNKIKEINMMLFRKATDVLPELHKSGDKLLMFNKHIIDKLLETEVDPQLKKEVIIKLLDITLIGDQVASNFLHIYQEFVKHIL